MPGPSRIEQMVLELANRFRLDPDAEFDALIRNARTAAARDPDVTDAIRFFGVDMGALKTALKDLSPSAPLAWNEALAQAAADHSLLMKAEGQQTHRVGIDTDGDGVLEEGEFLEPDIGGRARAAGYDYMSLGENVFAYSESAQHAHAGMVIDWGAGPEGMQTPPGHRLNLINPALTEMGVGIVRADPADGLGPLVMTQMLGARAVSSPMLVGAIYRDRDGDDFYSIGEGTGGVTVRVSGEETTRSWASGGYQVAAEGPVKVTFASAKLPGTVKLAVTAGSENVKLDLIDGREVASSASVRELSGVSAIRLLGDADIDAAGARGADALTGNDGANRLSGGAGADVIDGGRGRDALRGGTGADRLDGGRGADRLDGGAGADRLDGGAGRDALRGGGGRDILEGGPGRDRFEFDASDGRDRVLDFGAADRVDLRGAGLGWADVSIDRHDGDALVSFGETVVLFEDAAGELTRADFLF